MIPLAELLSIWISIDGIERFYKLAFFSRVYATLKATLSVGPSVGRSVRRSLIARSTRLMAIGLVIVPKAVSKTRIFGQRTSLHNFMELTPDQYIVI